MVNSINSFLGCLRSDVRPEKLLVLASETMGIQETFSPGCGCNWDLNFVRYCAIGRNNVANFYERDSTRNFRIHEF